MIQQKTKLIPVLVVQPQQTQHLASLYAYREQIDQLSKLFYVTPQLELLSDYETLSNLNVQLADIIR